MMKVLIIEDEHFAAERLRKILLETGRDIQLLAVLDSIKSAVKWLREESLPDLIFLDIQLADGLSFSIFEQIECKIPVIFTTAYDEYAIRAFEIHSIDYLLKPIDPEKLKSALNKFDDLSKIFKQRDMQEFIANLRENITSPKTYKSRFLVSKGDSLITLPVEQVAYFYAEDKMVSLFATDGQKFILNETLDHLESITDPSVFFRINRQCLVSIHAIKKVHYYFNYKLKVLVHPPAPEEIIVSKTKVQLFKDWLNR